MKKFTALILLLLMVGSTSLAFAWWDTTSGSFEDETFELGTGVRLTLSDQTTAGQGLLIPAGSFYEDEVGYTSTYSFEYDLSLLEDLGSFDLIAGLANVTVGGSAYDSDLGVHGALAFELFVNGTSAGVITPGGTLSSAGALSSTVITSVELRITLLDQTSTAFASDAQALAAYNALNGQTIAFDITFEIE